MGQNELTIYRKTARGLEELQSHAFGLEQRFRRALFIIDGRKDVTELSVIMRPGEAEIALPHLVDGGFIEQLPAHEIPKDIVRYIASAADPKNFAQIKTAIEIDFENRLGAFAETVIAEVHSCNSSLELRLKLRDIEEILVAAIGHDDGVNLAREIGQELTRLVPRETLN